MLLLIDLTTELFRQKENTFAYMFYVMYQIWYIRLLWFIVQREYEEIKNNYYSEAQKCTIWCTKMKWLKSKIKF